MVASLRVTLVLESTQQALQVTVPATWADRRVAALRRLARKKFGIDGAAALRCASGGGDLGDDDARIGDVVADGALVLVTDGAAAAAAARAEGNDAYARGDLRAAASAYEEAARFAPGDGRPRANLAAVAVARRDYRDGAAHAAAALALAAPADPVGRWWRRLARCQRGGARYADAVASLERATAAGEAAGADLAAAREALAFARKNAIEAAGASVGAADRRGRTARDPRGIPSLDWGPPRILQNSRSAVEWSSLSEVSLDRPF